MQSKRLVFGLVNYPRTKSRLFSQSTSNNSALIIFYTLRKVKAFFWIERLGFRTPDFIRACIVFWIAKSQLFIEDASKRWLNFSKVNAKGHVNSLSLLKWRRDKGGDILYTAGSLKGTNSICRLLLKHAVRGKYKDKLSLLNE